MFPFIRIAKDLYLASRLPRFTSMTETHISQHRWTTRRIDRYSTQGRLGHDDGRFHHPFPPPHPRL